MINLPNFLSLLRIPLAFFFLQDNPFIRALAIVLALITDGLDGFIARRYKLVNNIGTLLDPLSDKFFVFFAIFILINEHKLSWEQGCILFCRDFSVIVYGLYLAFRHRLLNYRFRSIWCGKITTVMQLSVLLALIFDFKFPSYVYGIFILLGILSFVELYHTDKLLRKQHSVN
jgi:CDP-diacylglycerol---glycerol-3-phosphate 3-phosphatidyltransferase